MLMSWRRHTFCIHWPFVRRIHRWPVDSPHQKPVLRRLDDFAVVSLMRLLNKPLSYRWFEAFNVTSLCTMGKHVYMHIMAACYWLMNITCNTCTFARGKSDCIHVFHIIFYILTHWPLAVEYSVINLITFGSGNSLMTNGTKPWT